MIAFGPEGIFLSSGDRQLGGPAQDLGDRRGKILRLQQDGTPPGTTPLPRLPTSGPLAIATPTGWPSMAPGGFGRMRWARVAAMS